MHVHMCVCKCEYYYASTNWAQTKEDLCFAIFSLLKPFCAGICLCVCVVVLACFWLCWRATCVVDWYLWAFKCSHSALILLVLNCTYVSSFFVVVSNSHAIDSSKCQAFDTAALPIAPCMCVCVCGHSLSLNHLKRSQLQLQLQLWRAFQHTCYLPKLPNKR